MITGGQLQRSECLQCIGDFIDAYLVPERRAEQTKKTVHLKVADEIRKLVAATSPGAGGSDELLPLLDKLVEADRAVGEAKDAVLKADDGDLINLRTATCFSTKDKEMIRAAVHGHEKEVAALVARLIRDVVKQDRHSSQDCRPVKR